MPTIRTCLNPDFWKFKFKSICSPKLVAAKCGHETKQTGRVHAFGASTMMNMPKNSGGTVDWCLDCIGKMSVTCPWCRCVIYIGNPITLYTPSDKNFKVPKHAHVYNTDPLQLVGCLGWNCASTGADRAGFWLPGDDGNGCVHRVLSPIEAALRTGEITVVNDLSSVREAAALQSHVLND